MREQLKERDYICPGYPYHCWVYRILDWGHVMVPYLQCVHCYRKYDLGVGD